MRHTNYLRLHRKQWALSQQQIANLVGLKARSVISSYELGRSTPSLRGIMALQIVYGVPISSLYPALRDEIEDGVMREALALDEAHRDRSDPRALRVRELLGRLAESPSKQLV